MNSPAKNNAAVVSARPLIGVLLMFAAFTYLPIIDSIAKVLLGFYPVLQVVWARVFFHLAVMVPVLLLSVDRRHWWPRQPKLQLLRSCFMFLTIVLFFSALSTMPLVDAIALVFTAPLVVTALSPLLLGERVGLRRWAAVVVGFAGAMMVVRPEFDHVPWEAIYALGAGTCFGLLLITTRKLSGGDDPMVTLTFTALVGAVVTTVALPTVWVTPTAYHLFLMAATGFIAVGGHLLVIKAMYHADASLLAPITYQELVITTGLGYVLFGDFPGPWTWAGIAVIVSSGLYIAIRERKTRGD